jgi:soluble lytic murein transglycosylase-like protein
MAGRANVRSQKPATTQSCRWGIFCLLPLAFCLGVARPASADLVHLTNGRVISVESWQLKGDTAVLVLRDGGQMEAPQSMIAEVLPDEYFHAKPQPLPLPASLARPVTPAAPDALHAMIDEVATRYGVDVKLAQAVVKVESNYQPHAISPKGAKGLMQLMPSVAEQYAVSDPFDPAENLDAGLRHLRGLLDRFKNDVRTALAAYNAGLFAVAKYGGVPPYRETQDYVARIMTLAR